MTNSMIYTASGVRMQNFHQADNSIHLIMIPGGPGMSADYLKSLLPLSDFSMNIWGMDLPGNGDNRVDDECFAEWPFKIEEGLNALQGTKILLGHSFGGMLMQINPKLDEMVDAMILLSTTPKNIFYPGGGSNVDDPIVQRGYERYAKLKNDDTFKQLLLDVAPLYFDQDCMDKGLELFRSTKYAHKVYDTFMFELMRNYEYQYVPTVPTLIVGGDMDTTTPLYFYTDDPAFNEPNIAIFELEGVNHFPWINSHEKVRNVIEPFIHGIIQQG